MEEELEKDMTPGLLKDLGMRYSTEKSIRKYRYGLYECGYCTKEFESRVSNIKNGGTKSCGCQKNKQKMTHGRSNSRFYKIWNGMVHRCTNPKIKAYKDYGARGITICEEWLDVTNFIKWAEKTYPNIEGVSLDRIDNNKGYSPENCRWVDKSTQGINQRIRRTNTSGYVGIIWSEAKLKWVSSITTEKKRIWLGDYKTKEEAALARDQYITQNNLPHKLSTDYKKETK